MRDINCFVKELYRKKFRSMDCRQCLQDEKFALDNRLLRPGNNSRQSAAKLKGDTMLDISFVLRCKLHLAVKPQQT